MVMLLVSSSFAGAWSITTDPYTFSGKVGIGTESPSWPLEIRYSGTSGLLVESENNHAVFQLESDSGNFGQYIKFRKDGESDSFLINVDANKHMKFRPNGGTESVVFRNDGKVGIGTGSPSWPLELRYSGDDGFLLESEDGHAILQLESDGGDHGQYIRFRKDGEAYSFLINVDKNKHMKFRPNGGTASVIFTNNGKVGIGTENPERMFDLVSDDSFAMRLKRSTPDRGVSFLMENGDDDAEFEIAVGDNRQFWIKDTKVTGAPQTFTIFDDKVGIGISDPTHKLEVNGTIRTKEVIVEATNWPDFVFEDDYELPTLESWETHIEAKGHLPGFPSREEAETQGVSVSEIQKALLQKIEEMSLIMIEQNKEIKSLRAEMAELKSQERPPNF